MGFLTRDKLTTSAVIILVLIVALVLFTTYSDLPTQHPLFGVVVFAMIPVLFVAGGVVFVITIMRS